MNTRTNPTARRIDGWKVAQSMRNYGLFLTPPAGEGIRPLEPGIHESASLRFEHGYFEKAAIVRPGWKPSIPFGQGLADTVSCYTEAGK